MNQARKGDAHGKAVIPLPPPVVGEGLLPIFAGFQSQRHDVGADGPVSR